MCMFAVRCMRAMWLKRFRQMLRRAIWWLNNLFKKKEKRKEDVLSYGKDRNSRVAVVGYDG